MVIIILLVSLFVDVSSSVFSVLMWNFMTTLLELFLQMEQSGTKWAKTTDSLLLKVHMWVEKSLPHCTIFQSVLNTDIGSSSINHILREILF